MSAAWGELSHHCFSPVSTRVSLIGVALFVLFLMAWLPIVLALMNGGKFLTC